MKTERLPFIDWMKCIGMALIVLGHVGDVWIDRLTPPFNPKQLGVAFFIFVTGFSLARERRPSSEVLFRRLFEVYLFGLSFALLISLINSARGADLNESNYLPLLFGANAFLDYFPANPTTWFIGTYTHILVVGTLFLRHLRIRPWMLVPVILSEVLTRALLMDRVGSFTAYMLLTNWATVFLLGLSLGRRPHEERTGAYDWAPALGLIVLFAILWPEIAWRELAPRPSFPFMRFTKGPAFIGLGLTSACVTMLYTVHTWSTYRIVRRLPDLAPVRFLARNTLIIFIAHMPVCYAIDPSLPAWTSNRTTRIVIRFLVCYIGLAVASEIILRLTRPDRLRDYLWSARKRAGSMQAVTSRS